MKGKTHITGGTASFVLLATQLPHPITKEEALIGMGCCVLGSLLPDIDHRSSTIAKEDIILGTISDVVCVFTKHRGFTHSPIAACLFGYLAYLVAKNTVALAGANAAFVAALTVLVLIRYFKGLGKIRKLGGIIAILTYIFYPMILKYIPALPTISLKAGYEQYIGLAVFVGAISHIVLDAINKEGVPLFWPISKKRFGIGLITTGTTTEAIFGALLLIATFAGLLFLVWKGVVSMA